MSDLIFFSTVATTDPMEVVDFDFEVSADY